MLPVRRVGVVRAAVVVRLHATLRGMGGLPGTLGVAAALGRRRALAALAATTVAAAGCAGPADPSVGATGDVYVALARARAIAVLDPVTDKEVGRISLASLGQASHPWRLGISPTGGAAVVPLKSAPSIGLVSDGQMGGGGRAAKAARGGSRRCEWVRVDSGVRVPQADSTPETAQALTADAAGRAYVLVGDGSGSGPSYAAVVELETGTVVRHLPLAAPGESVLAIQAARDGTRLYAAVWQWEDLRGGSGVSAGGGGGGGRGRLVALDTRSGVPLAQASLPSHAAVTDLALAAGPGGREGAVYASVATPGPSLDEDDAWYGYPSRYELAALDPGRLSPLAVWPLPQRPNATAVTPDGARAYVLSGSWSGGPWSMRLASLDLATGAQTGAWPLPPSCVSLALAPSGRLYVADALGDRLWRVDTRRDVFLGGVAQPGAPMAVAVRQ